MSVVAEPGFMPSVVPCLQREAEFTELLELYREFKPSNVLEIGTYHGGTLYHWLRNAQPGTVVVSVDSYATEIDNRHLYDEWVPEGVELHVVQGDSGVGATYHQVREIRAWYDWVFIDAGHQYHEVSRDWNMYRQVVPPSRLDCASVVCFHDILYPHVARLWAEIKAEYETLEIISDPTTEWHGIGCVLM